ncbi:hypothetical protein E1B28_002868 [Marasmius oreades]|uniref:FBD domain-containing protein n=1 Tax=Marasmius oreades TaxID=181124 RepID=A0A9P7RNM4_9AGAR|nr:uncharacterized protein E1B28_002868 [Marasmius oreades]KAG7086951.1 hypothetical protein E1B28_002868 [Marasmius oreades]
MGIYSFAPNILPILNLSLQRSAGKALVLHVDATKDSKTHSGFAEIVSLLMQHKARFREVSLRWDHTFPWNANHFLEQGPIFPLLKRVRLNCRNSTAPYWFWEGIRCAPVLEAVTLSSLTTAARDILANSQIRLLEIEDLAIFKKGFYDFREFLSTLHRIETMRICDCRHTQSLGAPFMRPLKNESLRTLALKDIEPPYHFLSSLELPSLETLVLMEEEPVEMPPRRIVSDLFATLQQFPSLHRLSFHFHLTQYHDSTQLVKLLHCLPNLTTLEVRVKAVDESSFRKKCPTEGSDSCTLNLLFTLASTPSLGRKLKTLYLQGSTENHFLDAGLLYRVVEALEMRVALSKESLDGGVEPVAQLTDLRISDYAWGGRKLVKTQIAYLNKKLEQLEVEGTTCAIVVGQTRSCSLGNKSLVLDLPPTQKEDSIGGFAPLVKHYTLIVRSSIPVFVVN